MKRELSFLLAAAMAASLAGCAADIADADSKMRMYFQPTIRRNGLRDSEVKRKPPAIHHGMPETFVHFPNRYLKSLYPNVTIFRVAPLGSRA